MNYSVVLTHISNIQVGDIVEINGELKTVGKNALVYDPFMGFMLWGDSYMLGQVPVRKVVFNTAK